MRVPLLAACATLLLVASAIAQSPRAVRPLRPGFAPPPVPRVPESLVDAIPLEGAPRAQTRIVPLAPAVQQRLLRASALRQMGEFERARDSLATLEREHPGHAAIVTERVRVELAARQWAAAERLARASRGRDSLLLARELTVALDGLGRPREALEVAARALAASPAEGEWAGIAITIVGGRDWRIARDVLGPAYQRDPGRAAMAYAYSMPLLKLGRADEAMRVIAPHDRVARMSPRRLRMSDELLDMGGAADTAAAFEALWSVAGDRAVDESYRRHAARRAWDLAGTRGGEAEAAPRLARELADVPSARWGSDLAVSVARALRESGRTTESRAVLAGAGGANAPEMVLERLYADLRESPSAAAIAGLDTLASVWPTARFALAEAQWWAGDVDSALANYDRAAQDPASPTAGDALERVYLLEENPRHPAVRTLGQIAWAEWRGDRARARAWTDSLLAALRPGDPYFAPVALRAGEQRLAAGDARSALAPLLAVAESLPDDRLAPRARQRAGDAQLAIGEHRLALQQYEECLARYPRAWNAAEVRRKVEQLRKERRF